MSDPCGTIQLALKPNAVPRINWLLSNFYFCANWSVVPCQMRGLEGPVWGGGYMPRRRRLHAKTAEVIYANNCQIAISMSNPLQGSDKNRAGRQNISVGQPLWGGLRICTVMGNTEAWKQLNWYSTNSDLTVPAEVICQQQYSGGYMPIDTLQTQT